MLMLKSTFTYQFARPENGTSSSSAPPLPSYNLTSASGDWTSSVMYTYYYKMWSNLVLTTIVPVAVLTFCNVGIFRALQTSRKSFSPANTNGLPPAAPMQVM